MTCGCGSPVVSTNILACGGSKSCCDFISMIRVVLNRGFEDSFTLQIKIHSSSFKTVTLSLFLYEYFYIVE